MLSLRVTGEEEKSMPLESTGQGLVYIGGALMALSAVAAPIVVLIYRRRKKRLEAVLERAYGPKRFR